MKLNKIFLGLIGMAAMTLASCSSDDKYDWATVSGPQVYFSDELPSTIEISPDASSFNVPINRVDASSSLTVNLTSTSENPMYTVPSSVSFNAGETTVNIPVTYDPSQIEFGRYDNITISVSDASQTSSWGIAEYKFNAGKTAWVKMAGKATYREDLVTSTWSVDNLIYKVDIEKNIVQEGLYRLVNPYGSVYPYNDPGDWDDTKDYYLTIDASDPNYVHVPHSDLGVDWGYGSWYTMGYVDYLAESNGVSVDDLKGSYASSFGKFADGVITMPAEGMVFQYGGGLRYANTNGLFAIVLPGYAIADYTSTVEYAGIFTNVANQVFVVTKVTLGPDATTAKAVVVEADADADAVADAIAAGDLEAVDVKAGENQIQIPDGLTGKLQVVLVILTGDKVQYVSNAVFEYYGGANPWKSIGVGVYTDDFIVPRYGTRDDEGVFHAYDPYTYEVEIEEHSETPGLYRLKNLYAGVAEAFGEEGGEEDIVIHAEDPNGVYFLKQATGIDFGSGEFYIESEGGDYVAYYASKYSAEQVIAAIPEVFGKVEDGVITLPVLPITDEDGNPTYDDEGNAKVYQGVIYNDNGAYYACRNGAFELVLPTASAAVKAKARKAAKASNFARRLSGASISKKAVTLPHYALKKLIIKEKVALK